jgi:phosphoglucosamine mutase
VAFDGDADRAIFVARSGKLVDGDAVLLIAACDLKASGRLAGNLVIATVMSNLGLEKALEREGIRLVRTPVGDKYVLEEMVRTGAVLGGEQSGHVIFMDHSTTGDGLITALIVSALMAESGKPLGALRAMRRVPQVLENVQVRERLPIAAMPEVVKLIAACERRLAHDGRLLVRYSGTEMVARVMVEGEDSSLIEDMAREIGEAIRQRAGVAI